MPSTESFTSKNKHVMYHRPLCNAAMEIIAVDHLVVTHQDARLQCLTIVDEFIKYMFIIPVRNLKAKTTTDDYDCVP